MVELSVGLQAGRHTFNQTIFFPDESAYNEFTSGEFTFAADSSAVDIATVAQAGSAGVSAGTSLGPETGAQTKRGYTKGLAVFVHIKGGFVYKTSIGGQKLSFEHL